MTVPIKAPIGRRDGWHVRRSTHRVHLANFPFLPVRKRYSLRGAIKGIERGPRRSWNPGIATVKLHLQSGAVADSGAAVCLSAVVLEKNGFRAANVGTDVRAYGYLIAR